MFLIPRKRVWTQQPQGLVSLADAYDDALYAWNAAYPDVDVAKRQKFTIQTENVGAIGWQGKSRSAPSYSGSNGRITAGSFNPETENWPGITVVAVVDLVDQSNNQYPSVSICAESGKYYGGWNLSIDRQAGPYVKGISFRAGDSGNFISLTKYTSIPSSDEYSDNQKAVIIGTWSKNGSIRLYMLGEVDGLKQNTNAHNFNWRNATCYLGIGGYTRSGERNLTMPHYMSAVFPREFSQADVYSLLGNPWQIFKAPDARIWIPVGAGGGASAYSLSGDPGSYAVTGNDATLTPRFNYSLAANAGSYALTGQDAATTYTPGAATHNYTLTADTGAYVLSGSSASFVFALKLPAAKGTYALSGKAATFAYARALPLDSGAYSLAGNDASLTYTTTAPQAYALVCDAGSYALTGNPANFVFPAGQQTKVGGDDVPERVEVWEKKRKFKKPDEALEKAIEQAFQQLTGKAPEPEELAEVVAEAKAEFKDEHVAKYQEIINHIIEQEIEEDDEDILLLMAA